MAPSNTNKSHFAEAWTPRKDEALKGTIVALDHREGRYGAYSIVTVRQDDGEDRAFYAYHSVAKAELEGQEPQVGQRIRVIYNGRVEGRERLYHAYKISVRGEPDSSVAEPQLPADDDEIPF
jgi:hypothetical protein